MEIFKKIATLFSQRVTFWFVIFIVLLISYGQIVNMYIWKDDNAIFFKFTHLEEQTGYLGRGILGEGPYKFSVAPYYVIYKIFGYENIYPYYILIFVSYFFCTYLVFKFFSELIDKRSGMLTAFLFASGYLAQEGFIWLASSMIQIVSISLTLLTLLFYLQFIKNNRLVSYLFSLFFYFLALNITPVRVHYLIVVILVLNLLYSGSLRKIKSIKLFLLRVTPFVILFYFSYLRSPDQRTSLSINFIEDILQGEFYKTYSFFGSIGNMVLIDKVSELIFNVVNLNNSLLDLAMVSGSIIAITSVAGLSLSKTKLPVLITAILFIAWMAITYFVTKSPYLNLNSMGLVAFFIGGFFLIGVGLLALKQLSKTLIFLLIWLVANLFVYSSYLPTTIYPSVDRYLAHSFIPLIGIFVVILSLINKKSIWYKIFFLTVLIWGVTNMLVSFYTQKNIVNQRSIPAKSFYSQLRGHMPHLNKGDVIYIDVSPDAIFKYEAAFSVGQMPETTAIAWRYGLDRYDFKLINTFDEVIELHRINEINIRNLHSFFYDGITLHDITKELSQSFFFQSNSSENQVLKPTRISESIIAVNREKGEYTSPGILINLPKAISTVLPVKMTVYLRANVLDITNLSFPLIKQGSQESVFWKDKQLSELVFSYQRSMQNFLQQSRYTASSNWQDRTVGLVHDGDIETSWQADRVEWVDKKASIIINMPVLAKIDRVAWINGFGNSTPTQITISVSSDGNTFIPVHTYSNNNRVDTKETQVIKFPPKETRFLKVSFNESLNDDSPIISEIWPIEATFSDLDILDTEKFLKDPYSYISDEETFLRILENQRYRAKVQVYWKSDKQVSWMTNSKSELDLLYDGITRGYSFIIPAGGTRMGELLLDNIQLPGKIEVERVESESVLSTN